MPNVAKARSLRRDQCVRVLRVPEQPPRHRLEPRRGTARRRPEEPFGEVDQFVFYDALERHCQVNSPRGTMPRCILVDLATFGIAFRL